MTATFGAVSGTIALPDVRARAAAALEPDTAAGDPDVFVHVDVPDAITPPAILLVWDDPWFEPSTFGPALHDARLTVLAIAGRLEPGEGIAVLEQLAVYIVNRLQADPYPWPQANAQAPRVFNIAKIDYLGARITYRIPVAVTTERT